MKDWRIESALPGVMVLSRRRGIVVVEWSINQPGEESSFQTTAVGEPNPRDNAQAEELAREFLHALIPHGAGTHECEETGYLRCNEGWDPEQNFTCALCGLIVCYCMGCDSDDGGGQLCDVCWCRLTADGWGQTDPDLRVRIEQTPYATL